MRRKRSFIENYAGHTPALDLREYLSGNIEAWGVLMMRSGRVRERFHIAMKGAWEGNDGTLHEYFTYADGHKSERSWTVHFSDDNHFTEFRSHFG